MELEEFLDKIFLLISYWILLSHLQYYKEGSILVGRDGRNSNNIMFNIVTAVLNSNGLDTVDAGVLPTPCLQYATKKINMKAVL